MNEAADISILSLAVGFLLLLIPLGLSFWLGAGLAKRMLIAAGRMTGQLFLVGIVLVYLFKCDNPWINMAWVAGMLVFATFSAVSNSELNYRRFLLPVFGALTISSITILWFFNSVLIDLDNILSARYLLVIGGMLIGNSLKGNIIGISHFYEALRKEEKKYLNRLGLGATTFEALAPFFRDSLSAALKPTIASMATLGLVFLPGMMTGQIIGGSSPTTAIKYQIAIVLAIFACIAASVALTIIFSVRSSFNSFGVMESGVFRKRVQ